jgi:hypothetical protein
VALTFPATSIEPAMPWPYTGPREGLAKFALSRTCGPVPLPAGLARTDPGRRRLHRADFRFSRSVSHSVVGRIYSRHVVRAAKHRGPRAIRRLGDHRYFRRGAVRHLLQLPAQTRPHGLDTALRIAAAHCALSDLYWHRSHTRDRDGRSRRPLLPRLLLSDNQSTRLTLSAGTTIGRSGVTA